MNAPLPKNVMSQPLKHMQLQVQAIRLEAQGICSFELTDPDGHALPSFEAGAHVDVHLAGGLVRSYSLAGDPKDAHKWVLGVLREPKSRGGSQAMHDKVRVGDVITVGPVRNAFPMARPCQAHHFVGWRHWHHAVEVHGPCAGGQRRVV